MQEHHMQKSMSEWTAQDFDDWSRSIERLAEQMKDMTIRKQFELYASVMNMSVDSAIAYALCDWMQTVGVADIHSAVSKAVAS
jgi:hypothetical protein